MTRVAVAAPRAMLYVREGCHLCDQFLLELALDMGSCFGELAVVDVDHEPALAAEYGLRVPVLVVAGRPVCEGSYDRPRVQDALQV
jgi:hypothetical protein